MAKSQLVHDYCDAVERSSNASPVQLASKLAALREFATAADLYGYCVSAFDAAGRPLPLDASSTQAHWVIFDNVYVRRSGGRSPANALTAQARQAGFEAKGGPRDPERAAALWDGVKLVFGRSATPATADAAPSSTRQAAGPRADRAADTPPSRPDSPVAHPEWADAVIHDTAAYWKSLERQYPLWDSGFAVFYSPVGDPVELMIVGTNPGGGPESFNEARARVIPESHDYFSYDYPLARKMRSLFGAAGRETELRQSLKLNLNFFRSRSAEEWQRVPAARRVAMEAFCLRKVQHIIAQARPRWIVTEGFQAFDVLSALRPHAPGPRPDMKTGSGQRLYASRRAPDGPLLIGLRHPIGARTSGADWERVSTRLAQDLER